MRAFFGWIAILIMMPLFFFLLLGSGSQVHSMKSLPVMLDKKIPLKTVPLVQNSYILDRDGDIVSEISTENQKRIFTSLQDIPDAAKQIFIVSEDQNFYSHMGFDISGVARALFVNFKNRSLDQGGSTITQQLARNLFLTQDRTYNRKVSELLYSYQLERKLDKNEILEYYLNTIYFQNNIYGIGTAAQYYFSKPLKALNLGEIAYLCAIPNNPALYNPLKNPKATKKRQERLLRALLKAEKIKKTEFQKALAEPISLDLKKSKDLYPDYVTYVRAELKELISEKEGYQRRILSADQKIAAGQEKLLSKRTDEVLGKGVKIETFLDPALQDKIIQEISKNVPEKDVQASAVVINHMTHGVAAISGGKNYQKLGFHRGFQAYRQPGSSIKPLLDYVPYIEKTGAGPSSLINADAFCKDNFCPKNYTGKSYGMVTLKKAFQQSYNTPAVRMLDQVGTKTAFSYLEPFHFSMLPKESKRLQSAIGGMDYGFSPLEMTSAYTAFATNGTFYPNHAIAKVTDLKGKLLYQWDQNGEKVWKPETNIKMKELLASVIKNGTGKKANHHITEYEGGKTGTTNNYNDLWFIGISGQYTAGVWIGKDTNGSIGPIYKRGAPLLIWKNILKPASY